MATVASNEPARPLITSPSTFVAAVKDLPPADQISPVTAGPVKSKTAPFSVVSLAGVMSVVVVVAGSVLVSVCFRSSVTVKLAAPVSEMIVISAPAADEEAA